MISIKLGAAASVGFISTLAAARPVLHHYMVQNREIPQNGVSHLNKSSKNGQ